MFLLRWLGARWLMNRLMGRRQPTRSYGRGYASPRGRGRFGMFGPIPYYSTRTRGGSSVSVGGCCLPLALGMLSAPLLGARLVVRRRT